MGSFYPLEIDTCPAYGWECGPNADIDIKTLRNKHERRNWVDGFMPHTFSLRFQNIPNARYLLEVKSFYMAMHGPHRTFLAKDHGDFRHGFDESDGPMQFATGDGTTAEFQLTKTYRVGEDLLGDDAPEFVRDITKPVVTSTDPDVDVVRIYVDTGSGWIEVDADVDPLTGLVTFTTADTPANDARIGWTGEYRCCVRFSTFYLPSTIDGRRLDDEDYVINGGCTLQEVPGE